MTKQVYDSTLKPAVDSVNAVTKYGVDTAVSVKNYGVNTVVGVKDYGVDKVILFNKMIDIAQIEDIIPYFWAMSIPWCFCFNVHMVIPNI